MRKNDVWLGVGGLLINENKILVVKKTYGKTKGLWTFPGGFVDANETMDEAIVREMKEETNITAKIVGLMGARTGVLRTGVSDNLILFQLEYVSGKVKPRLGEIEEISFLSIDELQKDKNTTEYVLHNLESMKKIDKVLKKIEFMPERDYGYQSYRIFK